MTQVAIIGTASNLTNLSLVVAWRRLGLRVRLVGPGHEHPWARPGEKALGRLDVTRSLDGVEPGLLDLLMLERSGIEVRNGAYSLLRAHDKLRTAACLEAAGIPHPAAGVVRSPRDPLPVAAPVVIKPRFGSWGEDVYRCSTERSARRQLRALAGRSWFERHGALVQELVPLPRRRDLRVIVAGDMVAGACSRRAARGEWRTNTALGATRLPVVPDPDAQRLAVRAARAVGCDLAGVDLLPLQGGGYVVLELNGAVDFNETYALPGRDVFHDAAAPLGFLLSQLGRPLAPAARDEMPELRVVDRRYA